MLGSWSDPAAVTGNASLIALLKGLAPAVGGAAVVPNDGADLAFEARSLYVGGAGDVKVTTVDGSVLVFAGVPAGTVLPVAARRVWATGSTATGIVALV
jgi:hypothetical protein